MNLKELLLLYCFCLCWTDSAVLGAHKVVFQSVWPIHHDILGVIYLFPFKESLVFLKSGTTWRFQFQVKGTLRLWFMVTVLSQDLVSQARSGARLQRGSCAPGPLRAPALFLLQKWVSEYSLYCSVLPPSCSLLLSSFPRSRWGHVLGTRIAGDNAEQCLLYTRTHRMHPILVLI